MKQEVVAPTDSQVMARRRVLMIIIDGYGFDPAKEEEILTCVVKRLSEDYRRSILRQLYTDTEIANRLEIDENELLCQIISPTPVTHSCNNTNDQLSIWSDKGNQYWKTSLGELNLKSCQEFVDALIRQESFNYNYAIWAANTPFILSLRRDFPTIITKTSGLEVGYEDVRPEVQGNSETGHQQLGNLMVAAQPPLEISLSIESGSFFKNDLFIEMLRRVCNTQANLNICFLLSGEYGDDGRVHSCWNHLEAFLKLCFERFKMKPDKLRIQAILDGRDSPFYSSVIEENGHLNFIGKLAVLLRKYDAEDALAWIIGRSIAMDRDYDEEKAKTDYELLTKGNGEKVQGIDSAVLKIKEMYQKGQTDAFISPIVVCDRNGNIRRIEPGDVFLDLNFRSDRQRAKIASLLKAKSFLQREASLKGSTWSMDWIDMGLNLDVYCLTDYHPEFTSKYGAKVIFPTSPHAHNFLSITSKASDKLGYSFKYLLLAESTKALHVGYFIRGRREKIDPESCEDRTIIPSYSHDLGINTDDDYYKVPQMKAFAITGVLANEMYRRHHDLIITNYSNPDMIGHLIDSHFKEVVESIEVINSVLKTIIPYALKLGFTVIVTSDHGNADEFSPSHGAHDVLSTFISPNNDIIFKNSIGEKARLFDLPWCILDIMDIRRYVVDFIPTFPKMIEEQGLVGKSLIEFRK